MAETRILLIEDEPDVAKLLVKQLEREGWRVAARGDGVAAMEEFRRGAPDLILLDLMLPGIDGLEVCKQIRRTSRVPIVMLTARTEETDRVLGLELGADDYVTKPFSPRELIARIRAVLRRTTAPENSPEALLRAGTLELDPARHEARIAGAAIDLTAKEFQLLAALCRADGRVLSREDLLRNVWGYARAQELDTRTVDQHVARLREKLGAEAKRLRTVRSAGYRLVRKAGAVT